MHRAPFRNSPPMNSAFEAERSKGAWNLWVTGPSLELQQKLFRTKGLPSTILIRPSMSWESDKLSHQTLDLLARAIVNRDVRCIVVCSQPSDGTVPSPPDRCSQREGTSGYDRMLQRVCAHLERHRRAQDRVLTQLDQIRKHAEIAIALTSQPISLCGMFYIPESDVFLVYDPAEHRFVPIAETSLR